MFSYDNHSSNIYVEHDRLVVLSSWILFGGSVCFPMLFRTLKVWIHTRASILPVIDAYFFDLLTVLLTSNEFAVFWNAKPIREVLNWIKLCAYFITRKKNTKMMCVVPKNNTNLVWPSLQDKNTNLMCKLKKISICTFGRFIIRNSFFFFLRGIIRNMLG